MEKRITITAKNPDEALEKAVELLRIQEDRIFINVLEKSDDAVEYEALVDINLPVEGKRYLESILSNLQIEEFNVETNVVNIEKEVHYNIETNENPILIGSQGKTLSALNHLVKSLMMIYSKDKMIFSVDVGNYRESRIKQLEIIATKIAVEVSSTKRPVKLDPMDAFERRIIHEKLCRWKNIYTESEGSGKERALVIKPVKK